MWTPITAAELETLVALQLLDCPSSQKQAFEKIRVPFYRVPIHRLGVAGEVFVVAHLPNGLLYFEDIEEGFEVGGLGDDGAINCESSNQYELCHVLTQAGL